VPDPQPPLPSASAYLPAGLAALCAVGAFAWVLLDSPAEDPSATPPDVQQDILHPPTLDVAPQRTGESADAGQDPADGGEERNAALPDAPFNPDWVGGACADDTDCGFPGGFCLREHQGWKDGTCSRVCTGSCPQKAGDVYSATACVQDPTGVPRALCVARCALNLTPSGCRPGYTCAMTPSARGGPSSERLTCLPDLGTPPPETVCTQELRQRGLHFGRPDLPDGEARLGGARAACQLDTPVLLGSPIHHVDWREHNRRMAENLLVSCEMALAMEALSRALLELDVVEVEHVGTYNCRGVAGSSRLSAHALGRAIDIRAFERATRSPVSVLAHWNGADAERRQFLRGLVARLRKGGVFSKVLGPDSDKHHQDHLHLEL
jgi:hypothetical protein